MEKKEAEIKVDTDLPWNDESEYETHCYRSGTVFYVSRALHLQIQVKISEALADEYNDAKLVGEPFRE